MDDKTLQVLTDLANKLGTTAEYLWGVLLKQAPITGSLSLLAIGVWVTACAMVVRYVARKTGGKNPEWYEEGLQVFAWFCTVILCVLTAVVVTIEIGDAVTALVNPEYWALRQILK